MTPIEVAAVLGWDQETVIVPIPFEDKPFVPRDVKLTGVPTVRSLDG